MMTIDKVPMIIKSKINRLELMHKEREDQLILKIIKLIGYLLISNQNLMALEFQMIDCQLLNQARARETKDTCNS